MEDPTFSIAPNNILPHGYPICAIDKSVFVHKFNWKWLKYLFIYLSNFGKFNHLSQKWNNRRLIMNCRTSTKCYPSYFPFFPCFFKLCTFSYFDNYTFDMMDSHTYSLKKLWGSLTRWLSGSSHYDATTTTTTTMTTSTRTTTTDDDAPLPPLPASLHCLQTKPVAWTWWMKPWAGLSGHDMTHCNCVYR